MAEAATSASRGTPASSEKIEWYLNCCSFNLSEYFHVTAVTKKYQQTGEVL
jgi:hypothetical protein